MSSLVADIRFGFRSLLRSPGMSVIAVLCLAIGIGANTAIFSVVHALLLKAMPFHEPDRIITVWQKNLQSGHDRDTVSPANFLDWREQNTAFSRMALWGGASRTLTGEGDPQRLIAARVSSGYFELFGVTPLMGRVFSEDEDFEGPEKTVILSSRFWNDRFNGDESIIGTAITIDSEQHLVVGVMPGTFDFPANRDIWVPLAFSAVEASYRDRVYLQALGRLKPDMTLTQAQSDMDVLAARLRESYPEENVSVGIALVPLNDHLVSNVRPAMLLLLGAVGMVLLITCANVANLLLVKGASRRREFGIRSALGAGQWRIVRQLLTESLVLSTIGGGLGILIAYWSIDLMAVMVSDRMPAFYQESIGINSTVLMFAMGLSILTGMLFGLVPSLIAAKHDLATVMKDSDHSQSFGGRIWSMKSLLVISEIALSFVLLIGAGLMIQSFQRMMSNEVGFDEENVISMSATLPRAKYPEAEMRAAFFREAVSRISAIPGVESAGAVLTLPFAGSEMALSYGIEGRPQPEPGQAPEAGLDAATASYFETMRIPLIEGRFIDERDQTDSENIAVISEAMAREQWPDESPLGQRITFGQTDDDGNLIWMEIVGVVGDIRHEEMSEAIMPRFYLPYSQFAQSSMTFVVRTTLEPGLTAQSIRRVVSEIDPEQPLVRNRLVGEVVQETMTIERLTTMLTGGFAGVALFLASIGLFGVMSYSVKQRVREIGIRMALGAQRSDVLVHFMKQGVILTLIGVVIGLIAAYGLTGLISSQLYQVTPSDPMTYIVVALLLTIVAMFACYLPARRATKVDPMRALRCE